MALDKDRLGNAIADKVIASMSTPPGGADEANLRALMKSIADEVIKEIKTFGVVTVAVTTAPGTATGAMT